jgi:hypothetical protein
VFITVTVVSGPFRPNVSAVVRTQGHYTVWSESLLNDVTARHPKVDFQKSFRQWLEQVAFARREMIDDKTGIR